MHPRPMRVSVVSPRAGTGRRLCAVRRSTVPGHDERPRGRHAGGGRPGAGPPGRGMSLDTVRDPHRHDYHELIWIRDGRGRHLIDGDPLPVAPGHGHGDRPRAGARVRGGRGPARRRRALRRRGAVRRGRHPAGSSRPAAGDGRRPARRAGTPGRADRRARRRAPRARPTRAAPRSSATCWASATCCGSSAGTTRSAPSAAPTTTPRCSSTAASPALLEQRLRPPPRRRPLRRRAARPARGAVQGARRRHRPPDQGADPRPGDARGRAPAALHRPDRGRGRHEVGFDDQLYFSRAFKRRHGEPPMAYRDASRGKSMHP